MLTTDGSRHRKRQKMARWNILPPRVYKRLEKMIAEYACPETGMDEGVREKMRMLRALVSGERRSDSCVDVFTVNSSLRNGKKRHFASKEEAVAMLVPTLCIRITVPAGHLIALREKGPYWKLAGFLFHEGMRLQTGKRSELASVALLGFRKVLIQAFEGRQQKCYEFRVPPHYYAH